MRSLVVRPSERCEEWRDALEGKLDGRLTRLVDEDEPGPALCEITTYINGQYRFDRAPGGGVREKVSQLQTELARLRRRLGWAQQRDLDLSLLRYVRECGCLSVVLGAGASKGAGAPLWPDLLRLIIETARAKGHKIVRIA